MLGEWSTSGRKWSRCRAGAGGLREGGRAGSGSLSGRCYRPRNPALELADSTFAAVLPECSHSQELRAAAHVTGALFTSRRRTRSRDACWDVLISCSRCRAARRHDMTAKDKPLRKRKRSDVESVQGVSEVVTEPHPRRDSALHAVHCMSGPVHARRCSLCHGNTAGCSPRHHRALPDGHGVYGGFPSGMDHPF